MTATPVTLAALLAHPAIWRGDDLRAGALGAALRLRGAGCRAARSRLAAGRADGNAAGTRGHRRDPPHAARARARAGAGARRRVDRAAAPALCAGARRGRPRSRAASTSCSAASRRMRCGPSTRRCARPNAAPRSRGCPPTTSARCAGCRSRRAKAARGACCGGVPASAAARRPRRCASRLPARGTAASQLAVHVLKRRGAELPQPVLLDVGVPAVTPVPASAVPRPPAASPRLKSGTQ